MARLNLKIMSAIIGNLLVAVCIFILTGTGASGEVAGAADVEQPKRGPKLTVAPAISHDVLEADEAGEVAAPEPVTWPKPFLTVMGRDLYHNLKMQAASGIRSAMQPGGPLAALAPLAPPMLIGPNFNGVNSATAGGKNPLNTHGAMGLNHYVQVTNSHLDIYSKTGGKVKSGKLSSFFKYTTTAIFDARVVYDQTWDRWVITADSIRDDLRIDSSKNQLFFIAVSKTSNPTGAFWIYKITNPSAGDFWDFPMLGMDQDAVIISANVFRDDVFLDSRMFSVAKSLLYNGLALNNVTIWTGLDFTPQPPFVLDQNGTSFLVSAQPDSNHVTLYALTNSSRDIHDQTLRQANIAVPAYHFPPSAPQPGTVIHLDTADARFVNASTQVGNSLFQIHSIDDGHGRAITRFYEFDTTDLNNPGVGKTGTFYASPTSFDFNASIAANANKDVFVTWTSVDTNINAQVRVSGGKYANLPSDGSLVAGGTVLYTSSTFCNLVNPPDPHASWGGYSAVTLDPQDRSKAWVVNETIVKKTVWGSRIAKIGLQ